MKIQVREACPGDSQAILQLIRETPHLSGVTLNFEREPDFFLGAGVTANTPSIWVAESEEYDKGLLGLIHFGHRRQFWNGQPTDMLYAHDLRVAKAGRGRKVVNELNKTLKELSQIHPHYLMEGVIMDGNKASLALKRFKSLPTYYFLKRIENHFIRGPQRNRRAAGGLDIRPATCDDIPTMQALVDRIARTRQGFPCYDLSRLGTDDPFYLDLRPEDYLLAFDGSALVGILGLWDQKKFRQTRVISYTSLISKLRPIYNVYARFSGGVILPPPGDQINYLNTHTICIENNDPAILSALINWVLHNVLQPRQVLLCGFAEKDPLVQSARQYRRYTINTAHYLASYAGEDPRERLDDALLPYIETARL